MTNLSDQRNGITLAEVVVSTLLVGFVLVAAMKTVGSVQISNNSAVDVQIGPALAHDLISEVPEEPDGPIGTETGESTLTRTDFDDVDDFDGWNASSPEKPDGAPLGYGAGWQRQVAVMFVQPDTLAGSGSGTGLKLITVTVTPPAGPATMIQALRSSLGMVERRPSLDSTFVTGAQIELQASGLGTDVITGTTIKNHGSDQ